MNDELGFEHLTKRQLVRFCKKFHKDCYRLVGQKMKLKDQLAQAKEYIRELSRAVEHSYSVLSWQRPPVKAEAEQFLKETE